MLPINFTLMLLSFTGYGNRFDFEQVLLTYEPFHHHQRTGGWTLCICVVVPNVAQCLHIRTIGNIVIQLNHRKSVSEDERLTPGYKRWGGHGVPPLQVLSAQSSCDVEYFSRDPRAVR